MITEQKLSFRRKLVNYVKGYCNYDYYHINSRSLNNLVNLLESEMGIPNHELRKLIYDDYMKYRYIYDLSHNRSKSFNLMAFRTFHFLDSVTRLNDCDRDSLLSKISDKPYNYGLYVDYDLVKSLHSKLPGFPIKTLDRFRYILNQVEPYLNNGSYKYQEVIYEYTLLFIHAYLEDWPLYYTGYDKFSVALKPLITEFLKTYTDSTNYQTVVNVMNRIVDNDESE